MTEENDYPGEPVIVASFEHSTPAHLARIQLEEEGIEARLLDEGIVQLDPLLGRAVGGVRLLVPADQAERALLILREQHELPRPERECPQCGENVAEQISDGRRAAWLSILLLGFPIPPGRPRWRCGSCGHEWKAD